MGRIIEGLWDCNYCPQKEIGGSIRECPNCGKPRDKDVIFYMPKEIKYVDEEKAKTISREPDWLCRFCDCLNSATYDVCQSCGSPRTSENLNYFENKKINEDKINSETVKKFKISEVDFSGSMYSDDFEKSEIYDDEYISEEKASEEKLSNEDYSAENDSNYNNEISEETVNNNSKLKNVFANAREKISDFFNYNFGEFLRAAIIIAAIIATVLGIIWIFTPKTQIITVDNTYWEQSIDIERYQTVDEEGWSLPDGARLHESKLEIYTYKKVVDHYEHKSRQVAKKRISHYEEKVVGHRDLGNGHFEEITRREPVYETYYETEYYDEPVYRNEPVYKTKYYYEIDKWLFDRSLETYGYDKSPYWEDVSNLKSDEREASRKEKYYIKGTNSKGKYKEIEMSYDEWNDVMVGDTVKVKVSIFGNGKRID